MPSRRGYGHRLCPLWASPFPHAVAAMRGRKKRSDAATADRCRHPASSPSPVKAPPLRSFIGFLRPTADSGDFDADVASRLVTGDGERPCQYRAEVRCLFRFVKLRLVGALGARYAACSSHAAVYSNTGHPRERLPILPARRFTIRTRLLGVPLDVD